MERTPKVLIYTLKLLKIIKTKLLLNTDLDKNQCGLEISIEYSFYTSCSKKKKKKQNKSNIVGAKKNTTL